jgi:hypothetical protein
MLIVLAALLLAAHFLRAGNFALVVICLMAPLLLLIKQRWSLIALQLLTYIGAAIWLNTLFRLVSERILLGRSWGGVVAILGSVTLITILAGLLLNSPVIKARYTSERHDPQPTITRGQGDQ